MSVTMTLVLLLQLAAALTMIGLILVQQGKGADMGTSLGSGSAGSLFGASGSANFLSRMTAVCATVFFAATLALALMASAGMQRAGSADDGSSVFENVPLVAPVETGPAAAIPGADSASGNTAPAAPASSGSSAVDAIPGAGADASPAASPAAAQAPAAAEQPGAAADAPAAGEESATPVQE
ncbi:hypothetical protein AAV94_09845 [Lampropedia cohaerens]|uniref:Protein-export membrane protein SecG n=1 Tax=Lampropedia cohaerens TaxID=1610491 RepID=A0A0U1PYI1_9BURK|nr:preprotein translocase subunit SecG [Lampropedia cohaerens]KKW67578.1 hypothetical protein AAV94_09845 [Lampropedia cohaerens]